MFGLDQVDFASVFVPMLIFDFITVYVFIMIGIVNIVLVLFLLLA